MGMVESEIKPLTTPDGVLDKLFISTDFILVATPQCSKTLFLALTNQINDESLNWLTPLSTRSSRQLFLGRLDIIDQSLSPLVFKKSRFQGQPGTLETFQPGSCINEIKTNLSLQTVVKKLLVSNELTPPDSFKSLSVSVETPIEILVDRRERSKYSIFVFEKGFDFGEILQYTDPPIQGTVNYNPSDWKTFCAIKEVLEVITKATRKESLLLQDYDIHQVLYRINENMQALELILIDSERFRFEK